MGLVPKYTLLSWKFRLGLLIVLATFLAGIFVAMAASPYIEDQYSLRWDNTKWIGPGAPSAMAYYRKSLSLDWEPARATLWLAAPDGFEVYVNGNQLGVEHFTSVNASGIYDATPFLSVGLNQIAVKAIRATYGGFPLLRFQAKFVSRTGERKTLRSDESWRVNTRQEYQQGRQVAWTNAAFDDAGWEYARGQTPEQDRPTQQLETAPELFAMFPRGVRIWAMDGAPHNATFVRQFEWHGYQLDHAWLGISSAGDYLVRVNNSLLLSRSATGKYMDVLDIGPYVSRGTNVVTIQVSNPRSEPHLLVSGLVGTAGEWLDFSSDEQWKSGDASSAQRRLGPVKVVFDSMGSLPVLATQRGMTTTSLSPILRVVPVDESVHTIARWGMRVWPWIAGMLIFNLSATLFFLQKAKKWANLAQQHSLELASLPHFLVALMLAVVFYVQYDVRMNTRALINIPVFFALLALAYIPLVIVFFERKARCKKSI